MSQIAFFRRNPVRRRLLSLTAGTFAAALVVGCGGDGSSPQGGPQLPGRPATGIVGTDPQPNCKDSHQCQPTNDNPNEDPGLGSS